MMADDNNPIESSNYPICHRLEQCQLGDHEK